MTKEQLSLKKVSAISLGCDKNRVDLEKMLFLLRDYGFQIVADVQDADIVIVNTCAFILPAKQEAIDNIIEMEALKKAGVIEKIVVTGCLPQRNFDELKSAFPSVDAIVKLSDNKNIVNIMKSLYGVQKSKCAESYDRILTTYCGYAYLKIADGCNNVCSFCTIPRIRGIYKSVEMDELVSEAKLLVSRGIKELILVAQDTTRYGIDLYGKPMLIELCKKLIKIKGLQWIRIHYAYPEMITDELLNFITLQPKMCNYLDIPLQHIDNDVLKDMRRRGDEKFVRSLIQKIKTDYPQIKLRSTFMVGFPGESRKAYKKLIEFLKWAKLDYVGFFPYFREENTVSYFMKNQISSFTKKLRLKGVQKVQQQIAYQNAIEQIGKKMTLLVDYFDEENAVYSCHSEILSPSVDFDVKIVDNKNVKVGQMVDAVITDFDGNSFKGEIK